MDLKSIISSIKTKNIQKKVIFTNPNDNRIKLAIVQLLEEWHHPVVCGSQKELEIYDNVPWVEKIINSSSENNNAYWAKLVQKGEFDGIIWGNISPTAEVVVALIKGIWAKEHIGRISSYFLMETSAWLKLFADCAIQANPSAEELAEIAFLTALSAAQYGIHPKIAMLSFSTAGSAQHEMTKKVKKATQIASELLCDNGCDAIIEWELQVDAAIVPEIALSKNPCSLLRWEANILIFPNLDAGNIWYKLVERLGWATAIWPIIQWLKKPGNDLSRGCSVDDILNLYYITVNS